MVKLCYINNVNDRTQVLLTEKEGNKMKLKKWVKVTLLIIIEVLTVIFMMNLKTDVTYAMKLLLVSSMIAMENLIFFLEI